jgi:Trk K+ transport system NAD-binding subunit
VRDFFRLLNLAEDCTVARFEIQHGTRLERQRLIDADLPREGVLVLAVVRPDGEYVGAPRGEVRLSAGDTVVVYGRTGC